MPKVVYQQISDKPRQDFRILLLNTGLLAVEVCKRNDLMGSPIWEQIDSMAPMFITAFTELAKAYLQANYARQEP